MKTKKNEKLLPANKSVQSIQPFEDKEEELKKKLAGYQKNIQEDFKSIKKDVFKIALIAGAAYVSYKTATYLLSSDKDKKTKEEKKSDNSSPVSKTKSKKKSSFLLNYIKKKATAIVIEALTDFIQENFQSLNKKDAKKDLPKDN